MSRVLSLATCSLCLALAASFAVPAVACGPYGDFELPSGQEEVDRLMAARALLLENHHELLAEGDPESPERAFMLAQLAQLDAQLDAVGHQYGCATTGLYWHTDLAEAQATAAESGKPILSLRMLGNLTDEYSCANSRYFRTTLYANADIAAKLRENFVLHWESVRPVPVITVDFGDGRVLRRTVTGNSAHYMLTPEGEPVDLLPGLYSLAAFSAWLDDAGALAARVAATPAEDHPEMLAAYHAEQLKVVAEAFQTDFETVFPLAQEQATAQSLSESAWSLIATLHAEEAQLDDASIEAIIEQNPTAFAAAEIAVSKAMVETPLVRMLRNLQDSIALDTVRNEYILHTQIHRWYAERSVPAELPYFTERVYAELFLTPSSDPWLGLAPADKYTGLEEGGLSVEGAHPTAGFMIAPETAIDLQ